MTFSGNPNGNLVYSLGSNKTYVPGTTIASLANPNIKWETTNQTDIGLDLAFLDRKLTVILDWYDRKSSGLLVSIPLPGSVGADLTGTQPVEIENAANAENKGIEAVSYTHLDVYKRQVGYRSTDNRPLKLLNAMKFLPGDLLVYDKKSRTAKLLSSRNRPGGRANSANGVSRPEWYMFSGQPLEQVFDQLSVYYGIEIGYCLLYTSRCV